MRTLARTAAGTLVGGTRALGSTLVVALWMAACGGDGPAGPALGDELRLEITGMGAVPAEMGRLHVWVYGAGDTALAAVIPPGQGALPASVRFTSPLDRPEGVLISLELPGAVPSSPGVSRVMDGRFSGSAAALNAQGSITDGRPFQEFPGAHSLFTTSNNSEGYPSFEEAGLWLFTLTPLQNVHESREVRVTPLRRGWTYEGWIVRQGDPEVWISYGKFTPDEFGLLTSRDDTGTGPFAGAEDFLNAGVEDVPGEEWTSTEIADQLGLTLPAGLQVPLALDAVDAAGNAVWHHAITVEPAENLSEGPLEGVPFPIQPYENPIGPDGPGVPRTIVRIDNGPVGTVAPVTN